ncbi:MAG: hypothetical protein ABJQ08_06845 [Paracoccaceae bacterium]
MKRKPETSGVEASSHKQFRLGVLATNAGHHSGACLAINDVSHDLHAALVWFYGSNILHNAPVNAESKYER